MNIVGIRGINSISIEAIRRRGDGEIRDDSTSDVREPDVIHGTVGGVRHGEREIARKVGIDESRRGKGRVRATICPPLRSLSIN